MQAQADAAEAGPRNETQQRQDEDVKCGGGATISCTLQEFYHIAYSSHFVQSSDGYASDNLEEPEEETTPKKRKQGKATDAKQK